MARDIASITGAVATVDGLAIKLSEQNMGYRVQHYFRSAFKQIRDPDVQLSLAQPDRVVNRHKRVEASVQRRRGRIRTQFAIGFVKDLRELCRHLEGRLARCNSAVVWIAAAFPQREGFAKRLFFSVAP